MKKSYSGHPVKRAIAGAVVASMISLSIAQPVLAFESMDGLTGDVKVYGLSFTGDFSFNKMSVNSFAYIPVEGMNGNYNDGGIVSFSNGIVKTNLPLLTFGDEVRYPGILYNHDGEQFYNHIAAAAEGSVESQAVIWPYVLGGVVVVGGIAAIIIANNNDNDNTPVKPESTAIATPAPTTTSTPITTSTPTPAPEPAAAEPAPASEPGPVATPAPANGGSGTGADD